MGDCTAHGRDVVEAALAHATKNKVEAAYRRRTAVQKRAKLMADWAEHCGGQRRESRRESEQRGEASLSEIDRFRGVYIRV
jgi:hypothetical protein